MEKLLKIEYLQKEDLKAYANNAKIHTAEQIEQIKNSIREFGFNDPIAIWKNDEIIEGHGRLIAAMEMEDVTTVPVIRLDGLSDAQRRAYSIIHNKITVNTNFDAEILAEELKSIVDDFDMTALGFNEYELALHTSDFIGEDSESDFGYEYDDGEEEMLQRKRIILTFTDEQEAQVCEMLGIQKITKNNYNIKELGI